MTETIALHGTKDLLQQARKDLVEAGFKDDKEWNDDICSRKNIIYLVIFEDNIISLFTHDCNTDTIIDLTPENLTTVIELLKQQLCTTNLSNQTDFTSTQ